jgi:predicted Fe-S protein YdhL (DUF1289 family)
MTLVAPMSPCINVCSLDERDVCRGCWRTRAEIARWIGMSADEQWQVLSACERRRLAKTTAAAAGEGT